MAHAHGESKRYQHIHIHTYTRIQHTHTHTQVEAAISTERVAEAVETLAPLIPSASFFRLQVEDKRCNTEIDDITPDVRTGLCGAVGGFGV